MSGGSDNQLNFIFPNSVYNYLNTGGDEISQTDCDLLVDNINIYDPCGKDTLKSYLKGILEVDRVSVKGVDVDKLECVTNDLKSEIKAQNFKTTEDIDRWCASRFEQDYENFRNLGDKVLKYLKTLNLKGAYILNEYFNFMNEDEKPVSLDEAEHIFLKPRTRVSDGIDGGAVDSALGDHLRLNLLKKNGVPVLFTALPHTDYLTKKWRGEPATYSSSSSSSSSSSLTPINLTECGDKFTENATKRHIKAWTPREHGSSASTVNAMSHLRRMATQPRITQVELGSLGPLLARGFMGGSMDGGAQLEVDFKDCESGTEGKNLSVRQSTQYATLFKSVVQRLGHHNKVSDTVVTELKNDLEEYRRKECKLFQDAFRLANALKSQNNGSLPDKQPITDLNAFKEASDEVAKSETHLLGCLTKILTETCKKP